MISISDYNFITEHLASAQQQNYHSRDKLSDMKARLDYVESFVGDSSPARLKDRIGFAYNYITRWDIKSHPMEKMTLALQQHIITHWS